MKYPFLWLTLKLMKYQKLRTLSLFLSILFSTFLLSSFGGLGYEFWMQVHEGDAVSKEFDSTQWILIALISVLLLLVITCSAILLHNLFSLTFLQKWKSLNLLMVLGACQQDIIFMVLTEISILYLIAAPLGQFFSYLLQKWIDITYFTPLWITLGILLWVFVVSLFCGMRLARKAIHADFTLQNQYPLSLKTKRTKNVNINKNRTPFVIFMTRKYYLSNRAHYIRIVLTILSAILLYVPASYLIHTNIDVQRTELEQKYGITYGYSPKNREEISHSLKEYETLASVNNTGDSVVYVELFGIASLPCELLSDELKNVLNQSGWHEGSILEADCNIYFLEDTYYQQYFQSCCKTDMTISSPAILLNHYRNRTSWNENMDTISPKTSLLHKNILYSDTQNLGIKIYYDFIDFEIDTEKYIIPQAVSENYPDELDFGDNVTILLPLNQLENICGSLNSYWSVNVCGFFQDNDVHLYDKLYQILDSDSLGQLRYTRKIYQEWFDSMHPIHLAMLSICAILFFTALLNVFCTLIFQYFVRKRGLAILWSLGQTEENLLKILLLESMRSFLVAILIGIPTSSILCYYIYNLYQSIWYIDFTLPWEHFALIIGAAFLAFIASLCIAWNLMKKQNYLQDIRELS